MTLYAYLKLTRSLLIDSYNNAIRKDRNKNNGGGLIIYIKNNICYKHRPDFESDNLQDQDSLLVKRRNDETTITHQDL